MPSVLALTAFLLWEEGGGGLIRGGLLQNLTSRWGGLIREGGLLERGSLLERGGLLELLR